MKRLAVVLFFLSSCTFPAYANEVLYQCVKENGEIVLQDTKPTDCRELKKYTYGSYESEEAEPEGLRAYEKELLSIPAPNTPPTPQFSQLYEQSLNDAHLDKCYYYKKQIEDSLNQLQISTGAIETQRLRLKILQAKDNVDHYCGSRPNLVTPNPDLRYAEPERYQLLRIQP